MFTNYTHMHPSPISLYIIFGRITKLVFKKSGGTLPIYQAIHPFDTRYPQSMKICWDKDS